MSTTVSTHHSSESISTSTPMQARIGTVNDTYSRKITCNTQISSNTLISRYVHVVSMQKIDLIWHAGASVFECVWTVGK
eukprot:COSAG05_NODE_6716_length_915_cov_1.721814_1_plen_78_part_10